MKMYIANCTQQVQDFIYRLPESPKTLHQKIEIGGQIQIAGDRSQIDVDAIVEQHARYGLVAVDEIDRTQPFIGLCYAVGKPVEVNRIRYALAHNHEVLTERGQQIRQEAAVAFNNALENQGQAPSALEMSVEEETEKRSPDDDSPVISEGVRVDRNANPDGSRRDGRPVRGRGRR